MQDCTRMRLNELQLHATAWMYIPGMLSEGSQTQAHTKCFCLYKTQEQSKLISSVRS